MGVALLLASAVGIILAYAPWPVAYFPTLKEAPQTGYTLQLSRGRLVVESGCIRLRSPLPTYGFFFGPSRMIVWPYGYSVCVEGNRMVIRNEKGEAVARVGDFVRVGGGAISRQTAELVVSRPLPEKCHGPYYVVSGVIVE